MGLASTWNSARHVVPLSPNGIGQCKPGSSLRGQHHGGSPNPLGDNRPALGSGTGQVLHGHTLGISAMVSEENKVTWGQDC